MPQLPRKGQCVDESGNPVGFTFNDLGNSIDYYYVTNLQGDVIQIVDEEFNVVCNYYYDAWGAIRKITDGNGSDITDLTYGIAYLNPIRYRGYYYDVETGLYYLQTRYYDPVIGRFISRDSYEYIGANGDIGTFNLYAYCGNNPVNRVDFAGRFWEDVVLEIIDAVAGYVSQAAEAAAEMVSSIADKQPSNSYIAGGVFVRLPKGLSDALIAQGKVSKASKATGIIANVVDIGFDVIKNIVDGGLDLSRKFTDSIVDIGISVGTIYVAGKVGAYVGTMASPIFGTIAGFAVGIGVGVLEETTPLVDWAKDGVNWVVDTVGDFLSDILS